MTGTHTQVIYLKTVEKTLAVACGLAEFEKPLKIGNTWIGRILSAIFGQPVHAFLKLSKYVQPVVEVGEEFAKDDSEILEYTGSPAGVGWTEMILTTGQGFDKNEVFEVVGYSVYANTATSNKLMVAIGSMTCILDNWTAAVLRGSQFNSRFRVNNSARWYVWFTGGLPDNVGLYLLGRKVKVP